MNLQYVLTEEMGTCYWPKGLDKVEIDFTEDEQEIRELVMSDVVELAKAGAVLSPGWWRQMGEEARAMEVEAQMANLFSMSEGKPKGKRGRDHYEVERILEKKGWWYRVQWAGYHPSWEAWRQEGQPGTSIVTWERHKHVRNTVAMEEWLREREE